MAFDSVFFISGRWDIAEGFYEDEMQKKKKTSIPDIYNLLYK